MNQLANITALAEEKDVKNHILDMVPKHHGYMACLPKQQDLGSWVGERVEVLGRCCTLSGHGSSAP